MWTSMPARNNSASAAPLPDWTRYTLNTAHLLCGLALILLMAGCGDSRRTAPTAEPETFTLEGFVTNGPLAGAQIEVSTPDGTPSGSTTTDDAGQFTLEVRQRPPFRIDATGGTLDGEPYQGSLSGWCETLSRCGVTPVSTVLLRLMDEQGLSSAEARATLAERLDFDGDPFADPEAAASRFVLAAARGAISRGSGLEDWLDDFLQWLVDDDAQAPPGVPVMPAVEPDTAIVTSSAGMGGEIDPASPQTVALNQATTLTITPDIGYSIASVGGSCGGSLTGNVYTTNPVTADCTVSVAFSLDSYTLVYTAGTGGSIVGASEQTVSHGSDATAVEAVADTGYGFEQWSDASASNPRRDTNVTADLNVSALFVVTLAAPANVEAARGNAEVSLSWDAVTDANGYNVYWSTEAGIHPGSAPSWDDWQMVGNVTSHTVTGLSNGIEYFFVVTATVGMAESPASEEVSADPALPEISQGVLNDTGITRCGNYAFDPPGTGAAHSNSLVCDAVGATPASNGTDTQGNPVPAGQDAHHGRDAEATAGTLEKLGGGRAGFDFTKFDASGAALAVQDQPWQLAGSSAEGTQWSCVQDNRTGLIWEVKVDDSSQLQHKDHTYSWYNPDESSNGGEVGTQNGGVCVGSDCDTHAYVEAVNNEQFCGLSNWALPTRQQLLNLMHNGENTALAMIDTEYFPLARDRGYWSSSVNARAATTQPGFSAWFVNFQNGSVQSNLPSSSRFLVRLVSTGR